MSPPCNASAAAAMASDTAEAVASAVMMVEASKPLEVDSASMSLASFSQPAS